MNDSTRTATTWPSEEARLVLIGGLRRLRREHHISEDCWYSCPKSAEGCCNDAYDEDECTCGSDAHNALVDDLLAVLGPAPDGGSTPPGEQP